MPNKAAENTGPVADPEATPAVIDKIRLVLTSDEVTQIQKGKLIKLSGIKAEIFLPKPGQRGVSSPDETFFGNTAGEVFAFLAEFAEDRSLDEFGIKVKAGEPSTNGAGK